MTAWCLLIGGSASATAVGGLVAHLVKTPVLTARLGVSTTRIGLGHRVTVDLGHSVVPAGLRRLTVGFGDGSRNVVETNTRARPAHLYKRVGKYKITLVITDRHGRTARTSENVLVLPAASKVPLATATPVGSTSSPAVAPTQPTISPNPGPVVFTTGSGGKATVDLPTLTTGLAGSQNNITITTTGSYAVLSLSPVSTGKVMFAAVTAPGIGFSSTADTDEPPGSVPAGRYLVQLASDGSATATMSSPDGSENIPLTGSTDIWAATTQSTAGAGQTDQTLRIPLPAGPVDLYTILHVNTTQAEVTFSVRLCLTAAANTQCQNGDPGASDSSPGEVDGNDEDDTSNGPYTVAPNTVAEGDSQATGGAQHNGMIAVLYNP